ncbi:unnamed protein product [Peniophora sp. CBMAI 1063]|nr:unnamed protein product [Peniophora sp. CBMAI 1063]
MQTPSRNSWSFVPQRLDYRDELQEYTALGWSMANGTSRTTFPQAASVAGDNMRHTPTVATPSYHVHIRNHDRSHGHEHDDDPREQRRSYATTTAPRSTRPRPGTVHVGHENNATTTIASAPRSRPRSGTVDGRTSRSQARSTKPSSAPRSSSFNSVHRIARKPVRITSTERIELENLPVPSRTEDNSLDALAALLGSKGVADEHMLSKPVPLGNHNFNHPLSQAPPRSRKQSFTEEAKNWAVAPVKRVKKLSDAARGRRVSRAVVPPVPSLPSYAAGRRGSLQPQTLVHAAPRTSERPRRNRSTTPAPQGPRPRIHAPGVYDAAAEWAVVVPSSAAPSFRASRRQGMVFENTFDVQAVAPREQAYLQLEGWNVVDHYDHGAAMQSVRQHRMRKQSMGTIRTMGTVASWNALNGFGNGNGGGQGQGYTPGQVGILGKFQAVKSFNKKLAGLFK